jgi:hypothetical protein
MNIDLRETRLDYIDSSHLAQDKNQWKGLVNT